MNNIITSDCIYGNVLYYAEDITTKKEMLKYYSIFLKHLPQNIYVDINCTLDEFLNNYYKMICTNDNNIYICVSKNFLMHKFRNSLSDDVLDYLDKCDRSLNKRKIFKLIKK